MRILAIPFGSAGDVHPFVAISLGLKRRGHDVTVITGAYFEKLVRQVGLDIVPLGTVQDFLEALHHPDAWHPRRSLSFIQGYILKGLPMVYDAIAAHYVPGETILVAGSLAFGARVAQEKLGVPLVSVHLQPALFRSAYESPVLPGLYLPTWYPRFLKRFLFWLGDTLLIDRALGRGLNDFRKQLELPPVCGIMSHWWHSPERILGLFPSWYAAPQPDWPPQLRLTGFPLYDERGVEELPAELAGFLATGSPPVVFTPGSANTQGQAFFRAAVTACEHLGRRGLLLTRFPEQIPTPLPQTIRHFDFIPFSQVLPQAAALVHHGGIGTSAQALAAGVPQVVMPLAHDQFDNAERLRRLGVGRTLLPRHFRGPALARTLEELLGAPEVTIRCKEVTRQFDGVNPIENACKEIEALASAR
jgi:UDP:flavonoid glycosyltransferase YjiC (YdhE family)